MIAVCVKRNLKNKIKNKPQTQPSGIQVTQCIPLDGRSYCALSRKVSELFFQPVRTLPFHSSVIWTLYRLLFPLPNHGDNNIYLSVLS